MGYWGWRPLLAVFISVWVVGCTTNNQTAATLPPTQLPPITLTTRPPLSETPSPAPRIAFRPTQPPSPTLTLYSVQPGDTLLSIARRFGVGLPALQAANGITEPAGLPVGQALTIPQPVFDEFGKPILPTLSPLHLALTNPTCTESPTEAIVCLGQVSNPLDFAVARVNIGIRLLRGDGTILAEGGGGIEQAALPAGSTAPYRVLLRGNWREVAGADSWLISAERADDTTAHAVNLVVENEQLRLMDGRYLLSATLYNIDSQPAQVGRVIAALHDQHEAITAYRVLQLNRTLLAGDRYALEIAFIAQNADPAASHTLYVEAARAG